MQSAILLTNIDFSKQKMTLIFFQNFVGPLAFSYTDYNGSLPSLHYNPYTWTQVPKTHTMPRIFMWTLSVYGCLIIKYSLSHFTYDDKNKNNFFLQGLNIIYVDAPVGTGFSYSTTQEGYYIDDYESASQIYQFLKEVRKTEKSFWCFRKQLTMHLKFVIDPQLSI